MARHFHLENTGRVVREQFRRNLGNSVLAPDWPRLAGLFIDMITAILVERQGLPEAVARRTAGGGLCLRIGHRLAHVGQQRFAESAVDLSEEESGGSQIRIGLRSIPALRRIVRSLRRQLLRPSGTRLGSLPELVSLQRFLENAP